MAAGTRRGMRCMNAVDTNLLVYAVSADESEKNATAATLIRELSAGDASRVCIRKTCPVSRSSKGLPW